MPASALLFLSGCAGNEAVVKKTGCGPAAPHDGTARASPAPSPAAPAAPKIRRDLAGGPAPAGSAAG